MSVTLHLWRLTNPRAEDDARPELVGEWWIAEAVVVAPDEDSARRVWPGPHTPRGPRRQLRQQMWADWGALHCTRLGTVDPASGLRSGDVVSVDERDTRQRGDTDAVLQGLHVYLLAIDGFIRGSAPNRAAAEEMRAACADPSGAPAVVEVYALPADVSDLLDLAGPLEPQEVPCES